MKRTYFIIFFFILIIFISACEREVVGAKRQVLKDCKSATQKESASPIKFTFCLINDRQDSALLTIDFNKWPTGGMGLPGEDTSSRVMDTIELISSYYQKGPGPFGNYLPGGYIKVDQKIIKQYKLWGSNTFYKNSKGLPHFEGRIKKNFLLGNDGACKEIQPYIEFIKANVKPGTNELKDATLPIHPLWSAGTGIKDKEVPILCLPTR